MFAPFLTFMQHLLLSWGYYCPAKVYNADLRIIHLILIIILTNTCLISCMGNDHNCSWAYVGLCTPPYWLSCPCPSVNEPAKWLLYWSLCQSPGVLKLDPLAEMERRKKCFSLTLCGKTWEAAGEIRRSEVQKLLKTIGKKINTVPRKTLFSTWQRNWSSLFVSITMGQKTMCWMRFAKFVVWRHVRGRLFKSLILSRKEKKMFLGYAFLPLLPNFSFHCWECVSWKN